MLVFFYFCLCRYWPVIENALIQAVFERNVTVRLMISCGRDSNPSVFPFLKSIDALKSTSDNIRIEVVRSAGTSVETVAFYQIQYIQCTVDQCFM